MRALAVGILVLGGAALATLLIPTRAGPSWVALALAHRPFDGAVLLVGAGLPIVLGAWALVRPPVHSWQGAVATSGFALIFVKLRAWRVLADYVDLERSLQLLIAACVLGMVVSLVGLLRGAP